jgi:Protein of unknown function (DUF3455)
MQRRIAAAAAIMLAGATMPASAEIKASDIPANLNPDHLAIYLEVPATGAQVYTCGKNASGAWAWNFKAPDAALTDTQKKPLGKHYAGPTWEGNDGGKVVAGVKANMPAPTAGAIPWLLLEVKSHEGSGTFTQAKAIVRMNTTGGVAAAQGCDEAHANQESRVPYTATYVFLK